MGNSANQRLKEFRKDLNLNQEEMANSLDLKQGSYSDIERGKVGVSGIITKLMKLYRINPIWLIEGKGEKIIENDEPYITENGDINEEYDRPDIEFKRKIFDSLDKLEKCESSEIQKELVSYLKSAIGRFILENSKLLKENARLKEEVIKIAKKHRDLKRVLNL